MTDPIYHVCIIMIGTHLAHYQTTKLYIDRGNGGGGGGLMYLHDTLDLVDLVMDSQGT